MVSLRRRLEELRARLERMTTKPLHSAAWPRVVAHLNCRRAIRQGAEATPEELAELEAFEEAMRARAATLRAEGRLQ